MIQTDISQPQYVDYHEIHNATDDVYFGDGLTSHPVAPAGQTFHLFGEIPQLPYGLGNIFAMMKVDGRLVIP